MQSMFGNCLSLKEIDMSSFATYRLNTTNGMFIACRKLKTIYAGKGWTICAARVFTGGEFKYCDSLVGGMGTNYDPQHIYLEYARIDNGPDLPGYFTYKPAAYLSVEYPKYYYTGDLNDWSLSDKSYPLSLLADGETWEVELPYNNYYESEFKIRPDVVEYDHETLSPYLYAPLIDQQNYVGDVIYSPINDPWMMPPKYTSHGVEYCSLTFRINFDKKYFEQIPHNSFFIESQTDGIMTPYKSKEAQSAIYNLSGQRLKSPQKGINIISGKKVLIK